MTAIITVPLSLDDLTFEQVIDHVATVPPDEQLVVDARFCTWASPYGLTALLTLAQTRTVRPVLRPPEKDDTAGYWSRSGFFQCAGELFDISGTVPSHRPAVANSSIIEVTRLVSDDTAADVVSRLCTRAEETFHGALSLESRTAVRLGMVVAEACQTVIDHAGRSGWLMLQVFNYQKRGGGSVAIVAIADAGTGYWDSMARRTGIDALNGRVAAYDAKLSVRSGTKRRSIVPAWDDDLPLIEGLSPFPGVQLQLTIPGRPPA